jgi:CO/xanthine dehydrogenase FAD-binding subunit
VGFLQPANWAGALDARTERPGAIPVADGTDVLADLTARRRDPPALLDLGRVPGLADVDRDNGWLRLGAAVTFHDRTRRVPRL